MRRISTTFYNELLEELEDLREVAESCAVIVEGKNDEKALRNLGVKTEFFQVCNGVPFHDVCDKIVAEFSDVILFTDLDREGNKLNRKLKSCLSQRGVRVNDRLRISLMNKLETDHVEDVYNRMMRIEGRFFNLL